MKWEIPDLVKTYKGTKGKKGDKDKKKSQSQGKLERALGAKKEKIKENCLVKHLPSMKGSDNQQWAINALLQQPMMHPYSGNQQNAR